MNEREIIPFDELEYMGGENSSMYDGMRYKGEPFTGIAVDDFIDCRTEIPFLDGKPHGRIFEVSTNGVLLAEENIEHGIILNAEYRYSNGNLREIYCKEPFLEKCWYVNGQLRSEWNDDYRIIYYEDGTLKREHLKSTGVCVCYSHSGEWFAKITSDNLNSPKPDAETTEFNESYVKNNFVALLENDLQNFCYFNIWSQKMLTDAEEKGSDRKEITEIVGSLICSNDLRIKYEGLNLAEKYKLSELVPLIKKQLKVKDTPPTWSTENSLHSYGLTISKRAANVLKNIKR